MLQDFRRTVFLLATVSLSSLACTAGSTSPATPQDAGQGVAVTVAPDRIEVAPSAVVAFQATVTGTANTSVAWSVQEALGGTIDATGLYAAPSSPGTFHVIATSSVDATKKGIATVTVTAPPPPPPPPPVVTVSVTPATGAVDACKTLQFTATVTGATNTAVTWSVQEGNAGGTISAAGLYTAPSGPGLYHVVGTSVADPTKSFVSEVTVSEVVLAVAVTPAAVTLSPGGTAQFTATVTNTCGTFTSTSVVTAAANGVVTVK